MKNRTILLGVVLGWFLLNCRAYSSLVITNADIASNLYTYTMSFSDLNSSTKFSNDVWQATNVTVTQEGSGASQRNYIRPDPAVTGLTSASFIYQFDFSSINYSISSVSFNDLVYVSAASGTVGSIKMSYSLDGVTWTTMRTTSENGSTVTGSSGAAVTTTVNVAGASSVIYYKVEYEMTSGNFFGRNNFQWSRSASGTPFTASFALTAIPEPSFGILLFLSASALVGLAYVRQRKLTA